MNEILGPRSEQILKAIRKLDVENKIAYSISIKKEVEKVTETPVALGAIYKILGRLEEKSYVSSRMGKPTTMRGGKRKRLYQITKMGINACEHARGARKKQGKVIDDLEPVIDDLEPVIDDLEPVIKNTGC